MQGVWSFLPNIAQILTVSKMSNFFHQTTMQAFMKLNEKGMVGLRLLVAHFTRYKSGIVCLNTPQLGENGEHCAKCLQNGFTVDIFM